MFERFARALGYERRALTEQQYPWLALPATAAGIAVSPDTALRSPATLAAVRVLTEAIGSLPVHVFVRGEGDARTRDKSHAASRLLSDDANPWTGAAELRMQLQLDALLHGAGYAQVIRTVARIRELHRLDPTKVTVDKSASGERQFKVKQDAGPDRILPWGDVIYLPTPGSTPDRPLKLIELAREAIAIDLVMARHQSRLFGNGARPSGLLKLPAAGPKRLGPETLDRLKASWEAAHGGGENAGRTAILEDGIEFQPLTFSSSDAQFLELRRFAVAEIARTFKVPLTLIGDLDRAVWRNVEELSRQFLQFSLLPWLEVWQSALTRVLFSPGERQTHFIEFIVDDLLRADLAARFTAYRNAVGGAWLTPNEVRAFDNRAPIEGGDELIRQAGQAGADVSGSESEPVSVAA